MNQNISKDDLDNPGWDKLNEYTPCPEGDTSGCVEINGKFWKQGDKKEANWRYNQAMEEAGISIPFPQREVRILNESSPS